MAAITPDAADYSGYQDEQLRRALENEANQTAGFKAPFGNEVQTPAMPVAPTMPPAATPTGAPPTAAPAGSKIVPSHPGLNQDELQKYIDAQKSGVDKYGADQEKAVMDSIRSQYHGAGNSVALGGAALADGIMQGTARAGSSNYLSSLQGAEQHEADRRLAEEKDLHTANREDMAQKQSLDEMSSTSPIGAAMMKTWGPLLDKLGIPKDKQAAMIPSLVSSMVPETVKHEDAMAKIEAVRAQRELGLSTRQDQYDQNLWVKLGDKVNALNAGSKKALGIAAASNMRADRLLKTAMDPNATPQDITNMVADLQGIYKGGVPDEISMKHGQYNSLVQELAKTSSYLSSHPQAAHSPEIVAHLKKVTMELKEIDNKVISDNLGVNKVIFDPIIQKDPDRWHALTGAVMGTTDGPAAATGAAVPTFEDEKAAEAAKLPAGTVIMIGGRKAKVR